MEGSHDSAADTAGGVETVIQLQIQLEVQRSPSWRVCDSAADTAGGASEKPLMEGDCDPDADTSGGAVTAIQLQIQLKVQRSPSWREIMMHLRHKRKDCNL